MRAKGKTNRIHEKKHLNPFIIKRTIGVVFLMPRTKPKSYKQRSKDNWLFLMPRTKPNSQIGNEGWRKNKIMFWHPI